MLRTFSTRDTPIGVVWTVCSLRPASAGSIKRYLQWRSATPKMHDDGQVHELTLPEDLSVEPFEGSGTEWDTLLEDFDEGTFCHLYGWREVMEGALGHETFWWVARDREGDVKGLLPLVLVRSRLFGAYLVSMPFLNYGGPVGTPAAQLRLAQHAADQATTPSRSPRASEPDPASRLGTGRE